MGILSGFTYRSLTKKLKKAGYILDRTTKSSHEVWYNKTTRKRTTVPNHPGDMREGTVRAIIRQTDIPIKDFLRL